MYHAYNADGIRTTKLSCGILTTFLLDGGDVAAEVQNDVLTASYLRGCNLICRESNSAAEYYLFDAHADVVALTDESGAVTKDYDYDAFGCERSPDSLDTNPFRYCGEYYDVETDSYYLRARYYAPTIGRFTQQDTHWSTANMIYGDNPQKINEKQDALGLSTHTMIPQITAVMQAGNLYVYGVNNPIRFYDRNGTNATVLPPDLSWLLPELTASVASIVASIEAAIASIPTVVGTIVGIAAAACIVGVVAYKVSQYYEEAQKVKSWVTAQIGTISENDLRNHSVYVITDIYTNETVYVGRTSSYSRRQYAHQSAPGCRYPYEKFSMIPVATNLSLNEARALEQTLITAFTLEALKNMINSIADGKLNKFEYEFARIRSLIGI